jgi:hypothetical protein
MMNVDFSSWSRWFDCHLTLCVTKVALLNLFFRPSVPVLWAQSQNAVSQKTVGHLDGQGLLGQGILAIVAILGSLGT